MLGATQPLEDIRRAEMTKLVRQAHPCELGLADIQRELAANDAPTVHIPDESVQHMLATGVHDERADRDLTSAFQRGEKCPLAADVYHSLLMTERSEDRTRGGVVGANLDRDRALTGRR